MNSKKFLFIAIITTAVAVALISAITPTAENSLASSEVVERDEHYMRGAQPRRGGIDVLRRMGVKTVVDLRSTYEHTDEIGVSAERFGLRYVWLPMSVWNPPSDEEAAEFISIVTDPANAPLFLFCTDGVNRAGEMTAIYRITLQGWNVEEALKEMDAAGFNPWYYSIRGYVWAYARKHRPETVPMPRVDEQTDAGKAMMKTTGQRVALVLCGGGSRGALEVGFYRALAEMNVPIDFIAGSSIGALTGAFIAAGVSANQLLEFWRNVKYRDIFGLRWRICPSRVNPYKRWKSDGLSACDS